MWQAILHTADIDWLRAAAERRLLQLRALDEIDAIQATLEAFARRNGEPVTDWQTLVRAGVYPGIPGDPTGSRY